MHWNREKESKSKSNQLHNYILYSDSFFGLLGIWGIIFIIIFCFVKGSRHLNFNPSSEIRVKMLTSGCRLQMQSTSQRNQMYKWNAGNVYFEELRFGFLSQRDLVLILSMLFVSSMILGMLLIWVLLTSEYR